jgi:hypothetical protein
MEGGYNEHNKLDRLPEVRQAYAAERQSHLLSVMWHRDTQDNIRTLNEREVMQ